MARVLIAQAFENLNGGYKSEVGPPTSSLPASFRNPRQPLAPPAAVIRKPSGPIPTSTARPKPSNAAIPYARTSPTQIDAGEIVLVNTRSAQNQSRSTAVVGQGVNSLCRVDTVEEVNKLFASLPAHEAVFPDNLPGGVSSWVPDGVCIGWDKEDDNGLNICNVCIGAGPTPILNDLNPDRNVDRRIFSKTCGPPVRLFLGLRATSKGPGAAAGTQRWKFSLERFSSGHIANRKLPAPIGSSFLVMAWQLGILTDPSSDMRFVKSGSMFVSIQPPVKRRNNWTDAVTVRGRAGVIRYPPLSLEVILESGQGAIITAA